MQALLAVSILPGRARVNRWFSFPSPRAWETRREGLLSRCPRKPCPAGARRAGEALSGTAARLSTRRCPRAMGQPRASGRTARPPPLRAPLLRKKTTATHGNFSSPAASRHTQPRGRGGLPQRPRPGCPPAPRGRDAGAVPSCPRGAERGQRLRERMVACSSGAKLELTLMVFLGNVHPLVFIDHLKRVQVNPSANRLGKIRGRVELQNFPFDYYLIPIIASNTKNWSFPLLPPLVKLQCILSTSGPLPRI